jgi:hypothetical protein
MKRHFLIIIIFSLLILIPSFDYFFNFSPIKELFEKRLPAEKPELANSYKNLKEYPVKFEKYFNDNCGFRKTLITINSMMMDKIFNESPNSRAFIGKDGWMYFNNHGSLLDAQGLLKLNDKQIKNAVHSFIRNWQKMKEKNIDYLLVIAADKATIYPEFLPDHFKIPKNPNRRIDNFLDALKKAEPNFPIIDLRVILKQAKEKEIIYQKTDTHWNRRGAHYAYVEIMNYLAKKDARFKPNLRSEFSNKEDEMIKGDISDIMNLDVKNLNYDLTPKFKTYSKYILPSDEEKRKFHKPIFFVNDNKNLPIIFVYKDSYFADLFGFINEHFSKGFFINEFPCDLDYQIIKKYNPNVVIQEFWEGRVEVVLDRCANN